MSQANTRNKIFKYDLNLTCAYYNFRTETLIYASRINANYLSTCIYRKLLRRARIAGGKLVFPINRSNVAYLVKIKVSRLCLAFINTVGVDLLPVFTSS